MFLSGTGGDMTEKRDPAGAIRRLREQIGPGGYGDPAKYVAEMRGEGMSKLFLAPGEWYDLDQAACAMVESLGLYVSPDTTFGPAKWVFASNNPVGNALATLLDELVTAGVLERGGPDEDQVRIPVGYDPAKFGTTFGG
jgi:hypothetical protein